ncbi:MAG: helix-turn-helix transcriptional regulator [Treponema sp.]|nr:helix-turn-helix transcriptional regulator [Treponema sp.]
MTEIDKAVLQTMGERLRTFRLKRNLSQEQLAELSELDRTYISGLERGKRNPSYLIIRRLCQVLKIKPNELF